MDRQLLLAYAREYPGVAGLICLLLLTMVLVIVSVIFYH